MAKILIGNFKGPKGDTGDEGPEGVQGVQGPVVTAGALSMNNKSELLIYDSEKGKIARPTQIAKTDEVILSANDVSGRGCIELWGWYHV